MTIGIYKLVFKGTVKIYIGQSKNIENRLISHINKARTGTSSKKLMEAFKLYGVPTIEVLLECGIEDLNRLENLTIQEYDAVNTGFNTNSTAEQLPVANNIGELNPMSYYSNEVIIKLFNYLVDNPGVHLTKVSEILGIDYTIILPVASCINHTWLKELFPERYAILEAQVGNRPKYRTAEDRGLNLSEVVSPEGIKYKISNIRAFAREHSLEYSCLNRLLHGKAKTHKGWKLT